MADNENTPIVETTVDGEPGTGEQNDTTPKADSNDLADKVQSALDSGSVCVVAAREKIDACGEFDNIESL